MSSGHSLPSARSKAFPLLMLSCSCVSSLLCYWRSLAALLVVQKANAPRTEMCPFQRPPRAPTKSLRTPRAFSSRHARGTGTGNNKKNTKNLKICHFWSFGPSSLLSFHLRPHPLLASSMAKHHPDLVMCRKQSGVAVGRLCVKCDGKCVVCDSFGKCRVSTTT